MRLQKFNYQALLHSIEETHIQAKAGTAGVVNRHLLIRNWAIGAYLVEYEQKGTDRAAYGSNLLANLAKDLKAKSVSGCSRQMLQRMRLFYLIYPQVYDAICSPTVGELKLNSNINQLSICSPLVSKLPLGESKKGPRALPVQMLFSLSWTHIVDLLSIDDPWKRAFYENECIKGNWSKRQLQRQIQSLLYERTGLSTDKQAVIDAAREQSVQFSQAIDEIIRDPYILEFTGLAAMPQYRESDLETSLLNHLQSFLLELGNGFCFEARQKRITVGNEHDYIDLVFYHRILRCHLLIDLKVRAFQHGDAGQMNFYLNYWKDQMMTEGDQPPVGLILCADKEQTKVEYAIGGLDQKLFVSRYLVALPKPEQIQELIENDRAQWEQQQMLFAGEEGQK